MRMLPGQRPRPLIRELRRVVADAGVRITPIVTGDATVEETLDAFDKRAGQAPTTLDTALYRTIAREGRRQWPGVRVTPALFEAGTDATPWRTARHPGLRDLPVPDQPRRPHGHARQRRARPDRRARAGDRHAHPRAAPDARGAEVLAAAASDVTPSRRPRNKSAEIPACDGEPSEPRSRPAAPDLPKPVRPERSRRTWSATNINRVVLTGNLTSDPELRSLPSGTRCAGCASRPTAAQGRFDQRVGRQAQLLRRHRLGAQGENGARYLSGAAPSLSTGAWNGASGRLPTARSARRSKSSPTGPVPLQPARRGASANGFSARSDIPVDTNDFAAAPAGGGSNEGGSTSAADDDIPF